MTRPRSKTLQWRQARLANGRGSIFAGAAPSGASGSGQGMQVCKEHRPPPAGPLLTTAGAASSYNPPPARAPPPRPRPLRGDPTIGSFPGSHPTPSPRSHALWRPGPGPRRRHHPAEAAGHPAFPRPASPSFGPDSEHRRLQTSSASSASSLPRRTLPPGTMDGPVNQSKHSELEGSRGQTDSGTNPYTKREGAWLKTLSHAPSVLPPPRRRRRKLSQSSFELPGFPWGLRRHQRAGRGLGSAADWVRIGRSTRTRLQLGEAPETLAVVSLVSRRMRLSVRQTSSLQRWAS